MEIRDKDIFTGERLPAMMVGFLREHHVMTVAVSAADDIWCSHAFYVFLEDENTAQRTSSKKQESYSNLLLTII